MRHSTALVMTSLLPLSCRPRPVASTAKRLHQHAISAATNGVQVQVGDIRAENLTLVAGLDGSASATLIMRVTNQDLEADNSWLL